jgi:hypothetical protein
MGMPSDNIVQQLHRVEQMRGRWWLPNSPDTILAGALVLDKNGQMKLTIDRQVDPVEGMQSVFSFERRSIPIILGVLGEGSLCTLQGLSLMHRTSFSVAGGQLTEVFFVSAAIFGAQIDSFTEFKVRDITVSLPVLMDWSNTSWCSDLNSHPKGVTLQSFASRKLPLGKNDNVAGEICVWGAFSFDIIPSKSLSMTQESLLTISFSEQMSLESTRKLVPLIDQFLSLVTLSAVRIPFFSCTSEEAKQMLPTGQGQEKPYYPPMTVWYYGMAEELPYDGLSADDTFLTYVDLKEANQLNALVRVLARPEEFGFLLPLLVPEGGGFHSYSPHRFLNAAQSLECLDRMAGHNAVLPADVFKARKKELLEAVQGPTRTWVLETLDLQYANEPRLRNRVENVVLKNSALLDTTVDKQKEFVDSVVKSRNYLVHLDSWARKNAILDVRLIDLTDKVEALARLSFLRAIGFSEDGLSKLFSHSERLYISRVKALFQPPVEMAKVNELAAGKSAPTE